MKFLLLFAAFLGLAWVWRANRSKNQRAIRHENEALKKRNVPAPHADPVVPVDMVECAHCRLHLAQSEAVRGRKGLYCSPEHQALSEA